jgi:hypothetical protein
MGRFLPAVVVLALALGAGACGEAAGGDANPDRFDLKTPDQDPARIGGGNGKGESEAPRSRPAPARQLAVIRGWADSLRRGDVERANTYFRIPSRVSNGGQPIELRSKEAVDVFNRTLPCGARLVSARLQPDGFVLATFRLTERPGRGKCGTGTGELARTLFDIEKGKIVQWLRAVDPGEPSEGPGGTTS